MPRLKILVVDDEKLIRWSFAQNLEKEGYEVFTAASGEEALEIVRRELPDLAILDVRLPGMDGIELLRQIKEVDAGTLAIMMTAHGEVETAVIAMKEGAYDYLPKPIEFDELNLKIRKALETIRLRDEVSWLRHQQQARPDMPKIIGRSEIMRSLCELLRKVATGEAITILLEGESGTGKDLFARTIHHLSDRRNRPFLDINCSAMQETLVESELFGYEKGAFTDAKTSKKGLFELGDGGTLFLDEIGEVSLSVQAKLLKFIENRSFKRVGGIKDISVDVRIIAATNRDLKGAVEEGRFREDLYFRLKVIPITLPPLRDRKEDIPLLVEHFIREYSAELKRPQVKHVSPEAMDLLMQYHWPGNIRELKNVLERILLLEATDTIMPAHLPAEIVSGRSGQGPTAKEGGFLKAIGFDIPDTGISLEDVERELLQNALAKARGNQTHAARLLNLSRDTLRYRLKKFGFL